MSVGHYAAFTAIWLILLPVVMFGLGLIFGEDINTTDIEESDNLLVNIANWFQDLGQIEVFGVVLFSGFFNFTSTMFIGYALFPWWVNAIIVIIPILLLVRAIVSATG